MDPPLCCYDYLENKQIIFQSSNLGLFVGELRAVGLQVLHDALHTAGAEQPEGRDSSTWTQFPLICVRFWLLIFYIFLMTTKQTMYFTSKA